MLLSDQREFDIIDDELALLVLKKDEKSKRAETLCVIIRNFTRYATCARMTIGAKGFYFFFSPIYGAIRVNSI